MPGHTAEALKTAADGRKTENCQTKIGGLGRGMEGMGRGRRGRVRAVAASYCASPDGSCASAGWGHVLPASGHLPSFMFFSRRSVVTEVGLNKHGASSAGEEARAERAPHVRQKTQPL